MWWACRWAGSSPAMRPWRPRCAAICGPRRTQTNRTARWRSGGCSPSPLRTGGRVRRVSRSRNRACGTCAPDRFPARTRRRPGAPDGAWHGALPLRAPRRCRRRQRRDFAARTAPALARQPALPVGPFADRQRRTDPGRHRPPAARRAAVLRVARRAAAGDAPLPAAIERFTRAYDHLRSLSCRERVWFTRTLRPAAPRRSGRAARGAARPRSGRTDRRCAGGACRRRWRRAGRCRGAS